MLEFKLGCYTKQTCDAAYQKNGKGPDLVRRADGA